MLLLLKSLRASLIAVSACLFLAAPAGAQSLESINGERKKINSTLAQHEERLQYLVDRIERTKEEVAEARTELAEQESALGEAIAQAEADPGDVSARSATLASIRYNRSEAKLERLQDRLDSAVEEQASIRAHQVELQQALLQLNAEEQRLKTAAAAAAKAAAKPQPVAQPKAPAAPAITVAAPTAPKPAATWPSTEDQSPESAAFAKRTLAALAAKPAGAAPMQNVKLNHNRGRGTETFTYLGDDLYRVNMKLEAGMWGFKVYNQTFWMSVPKAMADQDFVLIYDVTGKAKLHVFPARLLN
ncbi:hypothetical protein L1F30_15170 [Simiduia sp. 21SJ11W-1]|uniref:hypothetical protein n=1 Tax=Simiduia sp. 21SJ11W-1 TaxID=2909669 RepID=UPI00209F1286|nr:hypothetical protein [Simiduia sp. 21SJ11W-1]UTA47482.1 hypothetical protein L1F30_15170 [Simiduia sp. 21SJ11W-1]